MRTCMRNLAKVGTIGRLEIREHNRPRTALDVVRVSKRTHDRVPVGGEGGGRGVKWGRADSSATVASVVIAALAMRGVKSSAATH